MELGHFTKIDVFKIGEGLIGKCLFGSNGRDFIFLQCISVIPLIFRPKTLGRGESCKDHKMSQHCSREPAF